MARAGFPWFVVLPDSEAATFVARRLRGQIDAGAELAHPSGRPWLIGDWAPDRLAVARRPDGAIAVIGEHAVTDAGLGRSARRAVRIRDLDGVYTQISGSAHLVASLAGEIRVQGGVAGLRRVYHTMIEGVPVACNSALVLARAFGMPVDAVRAALRLLFPWVPPPLADLPMWTGIEATPPGHYLAVSRRGAAADIGWWEPPPERLSAAKGTEVLTTAVRDAVHARVRPGQPVVTILGDLDSAALCSAALLRRAEVTAVVSGEGRMHTVAPGRSELRLERVAASEGPQPYEGVLAVHDALDEPLPYLHNRRRFVYLLRRTRSIGPRLVGSAGPEVAGPADPWAAPPWWRQGRMGPALTPTMPCWATPDAVRVVRRRLEDAAAEQGLGAPHDLRLSAARAQARVIGAFQRIAHGEGIVLVAPFFDDQVVRTALSLGEAGSRTAISDALCGLVPDGDVPPGEHGARHEPSVSGEELVGLAEESSLARMGLIDPEMLRAVLAGGIELRDPARRVEPTLACEVWVRDRRREAHG